MADLDLNLLVALDALLREQSVSAAARRLGLSTSAMSRTLSRLRIALGDPILVPAGRGMVATPHALAIAEEVHLLKEAVKTVLSPPSTVEIREVRRHFTIRANEAFVLLYAAGLSAAVTNAAPGIRLRFAPRSDKDVQPLRDAAVDLDIGVLPARQRGAALPNPFRGPVCRSRKGRAPDLRCRSDHGRALCRLGPRPLFNASGLCRSGRQGARRIGPFP